MDDSIVFARWHQCAHMGGHIGTTWQIQLNLCFLRRSRSTMQVTNWSIQPFSHSSHSKSLCFTMGATFSPPPNCPFPWGASGPHLIHDSLGQSKPTVQMVSPSVQLFSHRWSHSVPILYSGPPSFKIALPIGGSGPSSNTWFPGLTGVLNPNGITIGSAVFAGLTSVTDRRCYSVGNNRRRLLI